jgi:hypothetical protein
LAARLAAFNAIQHGAIDERGKKSKGSELQRPNAFIYTSRNYANLDRDKLPSLSSATLHRSSSSRLPLFRLGQKNYPAPLTRGHRT